MTGPPAAAPAEFESLLPRIARSMRRPDRGDLGPDPDAVDVTVALGTELSSVGVARSIAALLLRSWHFVDRVDDVTTVISELVTNALRHGAPHVAREWEILLRLVRNVDTVMCVVADASAQPPVLREPNYVAETGRGLHVVQSYSRRWGWMPCPSGKGKIVWAVFW